MQVRYIDQENDLVIYLQNGKPRQLGEGANGKVYEGAVHYGKYNQEHSAVKQIPRPPHEYWQKKLKDEYMIHQNIEHPNIVKYYDFFEDRSNYYIFLELCNGPSLQSAINIPQSAYSSKTKKLPQKQANDFIIPIIDALYYLSNVVVQPKSEKKKEVDEVWQGVAHRDLKPDNIMLVNGVPKLIDFGLVKQQNPDVDPTLHRGTPYYMSPQNLGNQTYSPEKNDIWSVGVMWYQLLHGYFPWVSEVTSEKDLLFQQKSMNIKHDPQVDKDVQEVINAMLIYTEEDRPGWKQIIQFKALKQSFEEKERRVDKMFLYQSYLDENLIRKQIIKQCNLPPHQEHELLQYILHLETNLFIRYNDCVLKNTKLEGLRSWVQEEQLMNMDFSIDVTENFKILLQESIYNLIILQQVENSDSALKLVQIASFWLLLKDCSQLTGKQIREQLDKL